jgi:hypothetical protein
MVTLVTMETVVTMVTMATMVTMLTAVATTAAATREGRGRGLICGPTTTTQGVTPYRRRRVSYDSVRRRRTGDWRWG